MNAELTGYCPFRKMNFLFEKPPLIIDYQLLISNYQPGKRIPGSLISQTYIYYLLFINVLCGLDVIAITLRSFEPSRLCG